MRRSNMGTYISQVLIPMEKFYQIKDGKKVSKERNILPGYVLVEADLTGEIAHTLQAAAQRDRLPRRRERAGTPFPCA
jgi:transcriptional antiterminator NusG